MRFHRLAALAFLALASLFSAAPTPVAAATVGCIPTTGTLNGLTLVNDINAGFAALISSNSGASVPTPDCSGAPLIGQVWYDTSVSPPRLRLYGGSNGWRDIGRLDNANGLWAPPIGGGTASLASAATTDLCSVPQANVSITGSTTITSFGGSACSIGQMKVLVFGGAIPLTYNASTLILPGGVSKTTATGDLALAMYTGAGWNLVDYQAAAGQVAATAASMSSGLDTIGSTQGAILYRSSTGWATAGPGTANQVLTSNGAGANPAFANAPNVNVPKPQTVLSGPTSGGLPAFLPASSASLTITAQGVSSSTPLVITIARGYGTTGAVDDVYVISTNPAWSGLTASTTVYLGLDATSGTPTPISTTHVPIYQFGGTVSVASGQYSYDINARQMYLGNGTVANPVKVLFVAEAVTSSSAVTSATEYAYQRRYHYQDTNSLPGVSTTFSQNCNLGIHASAAGGSVGLMASLGVYLVAANPPGLVNNVAYNLLTVNSGGVGAFEVQTDGMVVSAQTGNSFAFLNGAGPITAANGRYVFDVWTSW